MPTSNEIASNRPLSGTELRQIMLNDLANILSLDGMFSLHIGYGRVSYKLRVEVQIDNPAYPKHTVQTQAKAAAVNEPDETLRALTPPPIPSPSEASVFAASERTRVIDSPNHARLEHNLPITILQRDGNDGILKEREVHYNNEGLEPGNVVDEDVTEQAADEWGI